MLKNKFVQLGLLLSVLVSLRLFYLFTIFNITYGEEGLVGILAKHISENSLKWHIFDYFHAYDGGAIIEAILAYPFFRIFGVSIISLRLVPLLFSVGILALIFIFSDKFFGRKIAIFASFLYIFSPPAYIKYSFYSTGNHHSILFFDILMLFIFSKIFFDPNLRYRTKGNKYFIFLGLISGFAMYFCFSSLTVIFLILLFWYIFDKVFFLKKQFFIFLISFIGGALPLILYIFYHWANILKDQFFNPFAYLRVCPVPLKFDLCVSQLFNIKSVFVIGLIRSFNFNYFEFYPQRQIWNHIYYFIIIVSFSSLLWINRGQLKNIFKGMIPLKRFDLDPYRITPESFLIMFPLVFLLSCFFTGYISKGYMYDRYYFTLYPFFYIYISLFLGKLSMRNTVTKILFFIVGTGIVLISIIGSFSLIGKEDIWTITNLNEVICFLRSKGIKHIYTYYDHKFPIIFESKEQIISSSEEIYDCDPVTKVIIDPNKYGEPYQNSENIVDEAVGRGLKFAYVFNMSNKFGHCGILEEYMLENRIEYQKQFIWPDNWIYFEFSSIVKPKDIKFGERWKQKNMQK